MAGRDVEQALAKVPLFDMCSKREIGSLAKAAKLVTFSDGRVMAREGEKGTGLCLLLDGTANVTIGGARKTSLGPGDFFGEVSLLDGAPRASSVVATSPVRAAVVSEQAFHKLIKKEPSIGVKALRVMAQRLRVGTKAASF
jgi:CRP/FNR family transcriptional regulator, cyclic AMP receptor protein